jgi:arylsulfatase A-like enzyme
MTARRTFLVLVSILTLGLGGATARAGAPPRQPNVIIFLSDDVGWGEHGFQGNKQIPTPNVDSIAKNGVRCTSAYIAATYCSPSRAGLMTGRYPTRFGHEWNEGVPTAKNKAGVFGLPLSETTLAARLKALGYATCCIGKWHLGYMGPYSPMARGFDEYYGTLGNTESFSPKQFIDSRVSDKPGQMTEKDFYTTDAYAARAIDWIGKQKGPYFLYLPFNAQHFPLQATQKYLDRFSHIKDEKRRVFAAMMSAMDDAVGKILAKVREMGQEENTLVFYWSDNGGPTAQTTSSNGPLRGFKATTSEGGTRIPFCVQWKGRIPAGKDYDQPILNLDVLPTVVTAAGGKPEPAWKLDGVDLLPHFTGKNLKAPHEALYWRFGKQWAIRKGDWKLVVSQFDKLQPRLINLAKDIGEANDLSEKYPEKMMELETAWRAWNAEQMEPLWIPNPKKKDKGPAKKAAGSQVQP